MSIVLTTCPAHFNLLRCTYSSALYWIYPEIITAVRIFYSYITFVKGYGICKLLSRDGEFLSKEALWRGPREDGSSFTGDPGRYVKKGSGYGASLSVGAPLQPRGTWYVGGVSYTWDFER